MEGYHHASQASANNNHANEQPAPPPTSVEQLELFTQIGKLQAGTTSPDLAPAPLWQLETLVPRLGEYLLAMGVLHRAELKTALHEQQQLLRQGQPVLLGQLLLEMGYVERATLDQAVVLQVMRLHDTLARYNQQLEQQVAAQTEQLAQALEQAKRLQQHKDEFVNIISHELRTPLTLILGYLDLFRLGDLGSLSEDQASALDQMDAAGVHLNQLINNLLFFATYYRNNVDITPEPLSVRSLFEAVLRQKVAAAENRRIRLLVRPPVEQLSVVGDPEKIQWVISEILENALKFTGPGSTVRLTSRQHARDELEIAVYDNGPGIPRERQQEIFEPFRQLDASTTRRVGGMGLGLNLAQHIMRAHGSRIKITSRAGAGTRVGISLPLFSQSQRFQRSKR